MLTTEDKSLDDLKLSNATRNMLKRCGILDYSSLASLTVCQLASMKIGPKRSYEIVKAVKEEICL